MAKRYRAKVHLPAEGSDVMCGELEASHDRALKAGIDIAVAQGVVEVEEVEAEQKVTRQWVEKTK